MFPLVKNNLPAATGGGPDANQIDVNSFAVDIGPSQFGILPPKVQELFNGLNAAGPGSPDYALLHYSLPWAASIASGGGAVATLVGGFPVDLAGARARDRRSRRIRERDAGQRPHPRVRQHQHAGPRV